MTEVSGAYDKEKYKGKTIQLKISEENDKHRWAYIGGEKVSFFPTIDYNYRYISNMGNKITPYGFAIGVEHNYFLSPLFKFIKSEKISNDEIMNTNERSVDPYDLHVLRGGQNSFRKIKIY